MEYYYEVTLRDGKIIQIPPTLVEIIKKRWDAKLPIHTTRSGSFPSSEIISIEKTGRPYVNTRAIERTSQIFNEPIFTEGGISARWVKKKVSTSKWDKYYGPSGYVKLDDADGMVTIAWCMAVHNINAQSYSECTTEEVNQIERMKNASN